MGVDYSHIQYKPTRLLDEWPLLYIPFQFHIYIYIYIYEPEKEYITMATDQALLWI